MSLAQSTPPTYRSRSPHRPLSSSSVSRERSIDKKETNRKISELNQRTTKPPQWLKNLALMQKTTAVCSFVLLAATAGLYAWSYNTPQKWSQQYKQLESLQRSERELTAINETYKHQLSQEAQEKNSGLVAPTPERVIFLKPTKINNERKAKDKVENKAETGDYLADAPFSY